MLLKITMAILLQGLTLYLLGLSCEASSLGLSVIAEPLEDTGGSMVRAHFTALIPKPCPEFTGVCAEGEDCEPHLTSMPFMGQKPESGWCARQWYKTVSSDFNGTITLGSNTEIYVSMNAGPVIRPNNGKLNQPPYACLPPPLRARVSCPHRIELSVRDMDGDKVRCRFADENQDECHDCAPHSFIELDEDKCILTFNGNATEGQYFIYLMAEDRSPSHSGSPVTFSQPLSAVPLHLSLSVEPLNGRCSDEPLALPATPPENFKFDLLPFQQVAIPVTFVSQTESILEIAVVGPFDLQKTPLTANDTEAEMTIFRVRHVNNNNLPRSLPISFVANTESLQSEPRCVWLEQREMAPAPLGTVLECEDTQMTLVLPLLSLVDVDLDELKLNDPTCPINHNSTHIMAQISFTGCGTDILHAESELIYSNVLQSKNPNTVITRKPILELPLSCRIPAVSAKGPQLMVTIPPDLHVFGEIRVWITYDTVNTTSNGTAEGRLDLGSSKMTAEVRPEALDVHVRSSADTARSEISVSECMMSESEDFTSYQHIVKEGCLGSSPTEEMSLNSSMAKTYRITLADANITGPALYVRCTVMLCLPILASAKCLDQCNAVKDRAVVTDLFSRTYVVNSGRIYLPVMPTSSPYTSTPYTSKPTSHAPEHASTMAAGVILTTIGIFLQKLLLY